MFLCGPQTRLGSEFQYTSGFLEPSDSWVRGRTYLDGCSFLPEKVYGDPISNVGVTTLRLPDVRGRDVEECTVPEGLPRTSRR